MFFLKKKPFGYQDYLYYLDYLFLPGNFFSNVLITTLPALPALPDYFSPKTLDSVPQDWPYLTFGGSQLQSLAVSGSFNFYKLIISIGLSAAGAKADCTKADCALPTILS